MLKVFKENVLLSFYRKIKWFCINYAQIGFDKKLCNTQVENHFLGPITYNTDSLKTSNNCDFIKEPRFAKAYELALATQPWQGFTLQWRVYIICWFAELAARLEGDFVECGVNTGAYSRAIIEYINFNKLNKKFYLLDTFDGFPVEQVSEAEKKHGIDKYKNNYKNVYEQVVHTFRDFNVQIIKGKVPDTLQDCDTTKICFLSIDMNAVYPEIEAATFFWDKLVLGGVMVLDDYGFPPHINQKLAFDAFAKEKNQNILTLPTGQGVIIKR